jgi:iron complex outermembrane receptor protein
VVYFASQHFGAKSQQKQKTDLATAVSTARFAPAVKAASYSIRGKLMTKTPIAAAISTAIAAGSVAIPQLALAQTGDSRDREEASLEEVVVVGSRIKKDVFTTSAPIDVVDVDSASIQGIANVGDLLQTNTIAAGSAQVTAAVATESVVAGGLGAQTISLRGLGANRTLTLINGRRAGPAGIEGQVSAFDLNVLPLSTIERVEILKDGASAIYGSDAIAGVVNIITRKETGGTIDGFISAPTDSGGEETRLSASYGMDFNRGNFRVTADYNKREALKRGERDYYSCGNQYIFDEVTGERADIVDPRTGERWCEDLTWGHVWLYDYAEFGSGSTNVPSPVGGGFLLAQYDYDNDLGQYIPPYATDPNNPSWVTQPGGFFPVAYDPTSDSVTNDNHPFQDKQAMQPEVELITFYGEGELDLTDRTTIYTEVLFNRRETFEDDYQQYWSYIYSGDYDFSSLGTGVPGGGNSISAAAGWFGEQWYSPTAITDHADQEVTVDYTRFVLGIRGALTDRWDWDLSYMYSKSDGEYTDSRIYGDSIFDQNWLTGSCEGTTTSIRGVPCVDIPWLDPELLRGNVSPEVAEFLFGFDTGTTEYTQWSVDGYVTGDLFELPAGTVAAAIGFHYREDEIVDTPGPDTLAGNDWNGEAAGITAGDDATTALFAEFDIPLLADLPAVQNLTLNASGRWTDVDSYGDDYTWKVGINWQIIDSLRFRANKGTSFRTPALYELYLADSTGFISQRSDPCIQYEAQFLAGNISENNYQNCLADPANLPPDYGGPSVTPTVFTGGGLGELEAETSDSFTAGFIWQPSFIELSVALDYFDFEVNDQVSQLGGERIIGLCYESDFGFAFGGTEPLCGRFDRTGLNLGIDNIRDSFINVAQQTNKGYDLTVQYDTDIGPGSLGIYAQFTKQTEDIQALFEETAEDFNGRIGEPEWVGATNVTYYLNNWSFFWGMHWVGETNSEEQLGGNTALYRGETYRTVWYTDDVFYHNFSASYNWDNGLRVLVGVANAFDENPPQLSRLPSSQDEYIMVGNSLLTSNYDIFGRRLFANLTWNFQ